MKFSAITFLGLAAIASAASNSTTSAVPTHTLTATEKCIQKCDGNLCCQAKCVNVPCPDDSMANSTNTCVAQCPKTDAKEYAECSQKCISSYYFSGTASLPTTSASASASATEVVATTTDSAGSTVLVTSSAGIATKAQKSDASTTGTATSATGSSAPTSDDAAVNARLATSFVGAAGFIAALFAL
ncbi:hypothetical protein KEM55_006282 [Ascosphaera atra]|nr:hypothetical protein KEM55_006282 [Ascosphaera atra]